MLAQGADVNAKNKLGVTALMFAVGYGHNDTVETLLADGADVNPKNKNGVTALMAAEMIGNKEIVRMLKEARTRK